MLTHIMIIPLDFNEKAQAEPTLWEISVETAVYMSLVFFAYL